MDTLLFGGSVLMDVLERNKPEYFDELFLVAGHQQQQTGMSGHVERV